MARCASQVKRISLELGGLAPLIVFNSAIISDVVKGTAYAKFRNSGQACVSPQNFYVQEGIYEKVLEALKHLTMSMKLGDGVDADTDLGPLINIKGVEKVEKLVNDAVSKGAKVVVGGKRATDVGKLYFQPTLLANVTDEMDIVHQEVFGPVISMIPFRTEEEVLRRANNTRRGLASYFYSQNLSQCYRMMEGLEAGMVGCNETAISSTETPFGGWKQSGLGREGGKYGMDEFLETKMCSIGLSHP